MRTSVLASIIASSCAEEDRASICRQGDGVVVAGVSQAGLNASGEWSIEWGNSSWRVVERGVQ
jgi:hypothetical protein